MNRSFSVSPDNQDDVAQANWRTTKSAGLASSPEAAIRLREDHLTRREDMIRKLNYPSMALYRKP